MAARNSALSAMLSQQSGRAVMLIGTTLPGREEPTEMELDELHEGVSHSLSKDRNLEETRSLEPIRDSTERQRVATAMRMGSLATAAHHAAGDLEEQFPQAARYMQDAASGFESISNLLRDPNLDKVAALIGNLGRKQPATIVAGVVLIGLGLSWFLKNSGETVHRSERGAAAGEGRGGTYGIH
jgi:hypothetical protein